MNSVSATADYYCNTCRVKVLRVEVDRRRPGGRTGRNTTAVLTAAKREVAAHGYAHAQIDRIAARAGVHRSTIYRRWGSKERLLVAAVLAEAEASVVFPDTGSLIHDLIGFLDGIRRLVESPALGFFATTVGSAATNPELADQMRQFWADRLIAASDMALRAVQRHEIHLDTDPVLVIRQAVAPLYYCALISQEPVTRRTVVVAAHSAVAAAKSGTLRSQIGSTSR